LAALRAAETSDILPGAGATGGAPTSARLETNLPGAFIRDRKQTERHVASSGKGLIVKLYSFFRSSAAYRVRIALNLKELPYDTVPVHMAKDGGQHRSAEYRLVNAQMRIPALALSGGDVLVQSLAIIEYLDEVHPDPPLLPADALQRAHVRAVAQIIACDIHPLNNSSTLAYLRKLNQDADVINDWYAHWIREGFNAIEEVIRPGPYAFGSQVGLADIFLIPQVANARRFKVPLDDYPKIVAVDAACMKVAAFNAARPDNQPDAE
jgi:maleylpyruvate isomerase